MKKQLISSLLSIICIANANCDTVDWFAQDPNLIYSDSTFATLVPDGTTARFGTFGLAYDFSGKTFAQLDSDFSTIWATEFTLGGEFYGSASTGSTPSIPWYIFIGSSESAFGIFTSASWVNTNDPFLQFADIGESSVFAAGGFGEIGTGPNAGKISLVPEPSSALLLGLGAAGMYFLRRRQKRA